VTVGTRERWKGRARATPRPAGKRAKLWVKDSRPCWTALTSTTRRKGGLTGKARFPVVLRPFEVAGGSTNTLGLSRHCHPERSRGTFKAMSKGSIAGSSG